jgi:hypothetical protein
VGDARLKKYGKEVLDIVTATGVKSGGESG